MAKTSTLSKAWKLSTGREFFDIIAKGQASRWYYDVLEIKLLAEDLERSSGMRTDDSNQVGRPTTAFLTGLACALRERGCTDCTLDAAFRIYNVVNTQFAALSRDLEEQVIAIAKG